MTIITVMVMIVTIATVLGFRALWLWGVEGLGFKAHRLWVWGFNGWFQDVGIRL